MSTCIGNSLHRLSFIVRLDESNSCALFLALVGDAHE